MGLKQASKAPEQMESGACWVLWTERARSPDAPSLEGEAQEKQGPCLSSPLVSRVRPLSAEHRLTKQFWKEKEPGGCSLEPRDHV